MDLGRHAAALAPTPREIPYKGNAHAKAQGDLGLAALTALPGVEHPLPQVQGIAPRHPASLRRSTRLVQLRSVIEGEFGASVRPVIEPTRVTVTDLIIVPLRQEGWTIGKREVRRLRRADGLRVASADAMTFRPCSTG